MDPAMHWELYKPLQPTEGCQIAILTSSYESWGKTNYDDYPRVRIVGENGHVWEFLMPGRDPRTWKLWNVTSRQDVPFILTSKISRWGHPEPPWEVPEAVSDHLIEPNAAMEPRPRPGIK